MGAVRGKGQVFGLDKTAVHASIRLINNLNYESNWEGETGEVGGWRSSVSFAVVRATEGKCRPTQR